MSSAPTKSRRLWVELCMLVLFIQEFFTNILRHVGLGRRRCHARRDLRHHVAVVTGANSGIGLQTAAELAKCGAKVIMACRSVAAGEQAKKKLLATERTAAGRRKKNQSCQLDEPLELVVMKLDLSSLKSVNEFADELLSRERRLDLLINNAGVMAPGDSTNAVMSMDGVELQFAVNHLGHFLLTQRLLGLMTSSARIINISSVHHIRGRLDQEALTDLNYERRPYDPIDAYCASKMANVLFTRELASRLEARNSKVSTYALNPGTINTGLTRHITGVQGAIFRIMGALFNLNIDAGTQTTLYCAMEKREHLRSGAYYANCRENRCVLAESRDKIVARELWELSCRLAKVEESRFFV